MKLSRTNLVLAVVLVIVVLSSALVRVDSTRPNFEIAMGDDMTYSPAYDAYSANGNFSDRRTLRPPVPGTIARDEMPLYFNATPEDAVEAGEELFNPRDRKGDDGRVSFQRGAETFNVFCAACHGSGGAGDGPVTKRGFPPPPSLLTGKSLQMKDGQLFHILTYGQGSMPPFAAQLPGDRRWDVVNYIRSLQPADSVVTERDKPTASPETGPPAGGAGESESGR